MAKHRVAGRQIARILQEWCHKSVTSQRISPLDTAIRLIAYQQKFEVVRGALLLAQPSLDEIRVPLAHAQVTAKGL